MSNARAMFAPDGPLVRGLPTFEARPGQVRMAEAIERALIERSHIAVEAPCGVGKTFAYLVPAIQHALKTDTHVVIVTANIALQEQLIRKDLPLLARTMGVEFTYALIKGINNYLCRVRLDDARHELLPPEDADAWKRMLQWAAHTPGGDLSDLPFTPPEGLWSRVNGQHDLCNGSECASYEDCFAMNARRALRNADVIVTNYHLFFAHLAVKAAAGTDVILPPHSAVICDEAHEMADIARDFSGVRLSPFSVASLVRGANMLRLSSTGSRLREEAKEFFRRVSAYKRSGRYKSRLKETHFADSSDLERAISEYRGAVGEAREAASDDTIADRCAKFDAAASRFLEQLRSFLSLEDENMVYWIEEDARATRLVSRSVDPSATLRERLFAQTPSVVLTSATLTTNRDFAYLKRETGADTADSLAVDSPFDLHSQAVLIVPRLEAAPNDPGFVGEMSVHLNAILKRLGGRTLALFTSYRNLQACAEAAKSTGVEILRQGDAPRSQLLEAFRQDRGTALFATSSFWQGIDVPGKALSCLVIDRIPFESPEDPLMAALAERDRESFTNHSLPRATILLRQGFGRLIRSKTDRGAVVIFDNRLFTARYGREILASLPDVEVFRDLFALERVAPEGPADGPNLPTGRLSG